jgi:cytochrome b involved in lipid metabolism
MQISVGSFQFLVQQPTPQFRTMGIRPRKEEETVQAQAQAQEQPVFCKEQVEQHKSPTDLWMVVHGYVYDVTSFVDTHPGGPEVLLEYAGTDATESFDEVGHSQDSIDMLQPLCKGVIQNDDDEAYYLTAEKQLKRYRVENVSVGESRYWKETVQKRRRRKWKLKDRHFVVLVGHIALLAALCYLRLLRRKWEP